MKSFITRPGRLLTQRFGLGTTPRNAATASPIADASETTTTVIPPKTSPEHWGFSSDPRSPSYFDGVEPLDMEVLGPDWDQFLALHESFGPGHWGPTGWGWLLGAGCAALTLSFLALLSATRPVEAIFSFLVLLLSLLLPLFCLEAEYVAAIHLMVYPGAILIFFSFATLTTDQRGHWDQWAPESPWMGGRAQSPTGLWVAQRLEPLRPLLVALPLLGLWWSLLGQRVTGSPLPRSGELLPGDYLYSARPLELARSSDMVALGLEIFQRRLLSLTLLGLLLLLAFLSALELLAPRHRRRSSNLFPRLGALGLVGLTPSGEPIHWSLRVYLDEEGNATGLPVERGKVLLGSWHHYGGDGWLLPCLALLALGLGALAQRRYAFLHSFLLLEALGLLLNLLFVLLGSAADDLGGSVLVLFSVAVAAAETAVGLALFLALSQGSGLPQRRPQPLQRRRVPLTPPVAMPRPSQTTPNPTIPTPTHQITSLPWPS